MRRLIFIALSLVPFVALVNAQQTFSVFEATIPQLRMAMERHQVTSHEIVQQYLTRIALYENSLNATIAVNPRALEEADARDRERAQGKIRGPLHGIPIALKDNIHTIDMPTTGGALAFDGFIPPYEATLTKNLRDAGAIIIAKTILTELANYVAVGMPANYSALAGFGFNPYDPRRDVLGDGRPAMSTGGSSSGIGTASSLWAANVGTETVGSILNPANQTMLVGIKPTVGRISRYGVIPITADHDTAGPLARTVTDAAILFGALESAAPDPNDAATNRCQVPPGRDYARFLNRTALKGARIGIPRSVFYSGLREVEAKMMTEAIDTLRREGAVVVDPSDIPSSVEFQSWPMCAGMVVDKSEPSRCSEVLNYGMKRDFNKWLASLGASAPVHTLTELRQWNRAHERAGSIKYGQALLDVSDEMDLERDRARYEADRAKDLLLSTTRGIDAIMKTEQLDALLFPGLSSASIAARAGYPTVIVPFGFVAKPPSPLGVSFTGMACSEPRLIALAYAFEQATKRRVPPPLR
jgi:amidase